MENVVLMVILRCGDERKRLTKVIETPPIVVPEMTIMMGKFDFHITSILWDTSAKLMYLASAFDFYGHNAKQEAHAYMNDLIDAGFN